MNKKGLSILLALSMVFSLNTFAFAEEAVVEDDAVVVEAAAEDEVNVSVSQNIGEYAQSLNAYSDLTSFKDGDTVSAGSELKLRSIQLVLRYGRFTNVPGVAYYKSKKITGSDLGLYIYDKDEKYRIPVKGIKVEGNSKKTGEVKFSLKSLASYKELRVVEGAGWVTDKEAKAVYKTIKTAFKGAKSQSYTAYIAPSFVRGSISESALKTLKKAGKTLSAGEIDKLAGDYRLYDDANGAVVIKAKNGSVKKVQFVYLEYTYAKINGGTNSDVRKVKVKTRNLKKDVDYKVDGDSINFDGLSTFSGEPCKAK